MITVNLQDADLNPEATGMYVAYIESGGINIPFAERKIMYYDADIRKWGYPGSSVNYRGTVYGWIGPLPAMRVET